MQSILSRIKGDKVIWAVVLLLSVFSILAVYSSTGKLAFRFQAGNTEYYLIKHLVILLLGLVFMYLAHLMKYTLYSRIFQLVLYLAVPLLAVTLIYGIKTNEAPRWLEVFNLSFQTSDLAKLTLIIYLARLLSKKQENIKDFKSAFIPIIVPVLVVCLLILPANFSTAAILFTTCIVLMFIGRVNIKHILTLTGIGTLILVILILVATRHEEVLPRWGTWKARLERFAQGDNEESYQADQAKIAIASGGIIGKLPGNSTQRNFIPHPYSDFIYAIIIEEYGLIGGIVIVMLYLILLFRAVKIVVRCPKTFGALLTIGVTFSLVFQAMINMAVAVSLLPVTGQPLPLVSMGGTSIWFTSLSIGIILSVSRETECITQPAAGDEKVES
jgi:cell division protein FtsW